MSCSSSRNQNLLTAVTKNFLLNQMNQTLLEKTKLVREISDGKNEIPHKFLGRKI